MEATLNIAPRTCDRDNVVDAVKVARQEQLRRRHRSSSVSAAAAAAVQSVLQKLANDVDGEIVEERRTSVSKKTSNSSICSHPRVDSSRDGVHSVLESSLNKIQWGSEEIQRVLDDIGGKELHDIQTESDSQQDEVQETPTTPSSSRQHLLQCFVRQISEQLSSECTLSTGAGSFSHIDPNERAKVGSPRRSSLSNISATSRGGTGSYHEYTYRRRSSLSYISTKSEGDNHLEHTQECSNRRRSSLDYISTVFGSGNHLKHTPHDQAGMACPSSLGHLSVSVSASRSGTCSTSFAANSTLIQPQQAIMVPLNDEHLHTSEDEAHLPAGRRGSMKRNSSILGLEILVEADDEASNSAPNKSESNEDVKALPVPTVPDNYASSSSQDPPTSQEVQSKKPQDACGSTSTRFGTQQPWPQHVSTCTMSQHFRDQQRVRGQSKLRFLAKQLSERLAVEAVAED